ncbi:ornithine carbamoyltransferase [Nocardiopsis terrae]|uniref:Ornithine carbamoyltransferase n=1 Tax=Nocardiopsis terrae TaxID=372655 RepID=A0ABR9HAL9_9ACTN|nr:ornithine carbamoyltransferase [Nocardiopsis terrae]MBE1455951.1 ornithine carbamoyltransferase [Nocardiopsis terrae]GHC96538.1 ornithine carbamoyltransferase [Nocardiopsis terrae]
MTNVRHLLSLRDLSVAEVTDIARRGTEIAADPGVCGTPLRGRIVGVYFRVTSTRTRTAFSTAAMRLGAQVMPYGPADLQLNTGETVADTARVLSGMLDGLVARTAGPFDELRTLAGQKDMAVVNAMNEDEHPTQALADLTTLLTRFPSLDGVRVLYVGEGNNTAVALARSLPLFRGAELELRTPPGYGLDPAVLAEARGLAEAHGSRVVERHDMHGLPARVDAVYTTRWQTTGTSKADPEWREVFSLFTVDTDLMGRYPDAVFLHDLPAHRGDEVTAEVLDGPSSIAFEQAQNKLHSAMAVLEWCLS